MRLGSAGAPAPKIARKKGGDLSTSPQSGSRLGDRGTRSDRVIEVRTLRVRVSPGLEIVLAHVLNTVSVTVLERHLDVARKGVAGERFDPSAIDSHCVTY